MTYNDKLKKNLIQELIQLLTFAQVTPQGVPVEALTLSQTHHLAVRVHAQEELVVGSVGLQRSCVPYHDELYSGAGDGHRQSLEVVQDALALLETTLWSPRLFWSAESLTS